MREWRNGDRLEYVGSRDGRVRLGTAVRLLRWCPIDGSIGKVWAIQIDFDDTFMVNSRESTRSVKNCRRVFEMVLRKP